MFYQLLNLIQVNPERRQNQELPVQMFDLLVQFGHRAEERHAARGVEEMKGRRGEGGEWEKKRRAQGAGRRAQSESEEEKQVL